MFQPWRMQLRQAEEALAAARLDEARALVREGDLPEFLPAKKLMTRLATQFVERGQRHAELGQSLAGWRDLEAAVELGAAAESLSPLREQLVAQALSEAERYLSADEPTAAIARLQALQTRGQAGAEVRELLRVADKLQAAGRFARQANFAAADAELAGAVQLRPGLPVLQERRDELRKKEIAFRAFAPTCTTPWLRSAGAKSSTWRSASWSWCPATRWPLKRGLRPGRWSAWPASSRPQAWPRRPRSRKRKPVARAGWHAQNMEVMGVEHLSSHALRIHAQGRATRPKPEA